MGKKREEISDEFKWAIEDLYANDELWEVDFKKVGELAEKLKGFQGTLGESCEQLSQYMETYVEMSKLFEKVYVYANQKLHENTGNPAYQALSGRAQSLGVLTGESTAFFEPEILAIPTDKFQEYMKEESLQKYSHYFEEICRQKEHILSPELEELLAQAGEVCEGASDIFSMFNNADLKFEEVKDEKGNLRMLTHGTYIALLEDEDREVRRQAFEHLYHKYEEYVGDIHMKYGTSAGYRLVDVYRDGVATGETPTNGGAVGTWTGSAAEITFSATANQVRATQVVVTIEGGATPDTDVVNVTDMQYADAYYMEEDGVAYWDIQMYNVDETGEYYEMPIVFLGVEAKSKTALNGTYDLLLALYGTSVNEDTYEIEGVWNDESIAATLTIKNVDNEGNYSFVGTFVGEDGKTYKINTVANVYAEDDATEEVIELKEEGTDEPGDDPVTPPTPPTTDGAVTFDADVDQGNAGTDSNNAAAYTITKSGVTMEVSSGILGTYNNEMHYRVYKNQTLTLISTVGKIVKVEFTCTANDAEKYGPGCFTVDGGDYTYAGPVGTWTGSASEITFTASTNQVRATQVVVTLASTGTGVEDVVTVEVPVKVIENGQLMIIRGENVYNVLGAQVK